MRISDWSSDVCSSDLRKFTMWTKFRAQNMFHTPGFRLEWDGVSIRSAASLPPWLRVEEYLLSGVGRIYPRRPEQFGHIILSCDEREEQRAVDRMMDALQLVLGLANLYETWGRSEEHTSELQSLMRISYAVFC